MKDLNQHALWIVGGCFGLAACASTASDGAGAGKDDSGWLSNTSFEVAAEISGRVGTVATGEWSELATDRALQLSLIDEQVKYAKNGTEAENFRINNLIDDADVIGVEVDGDLVWLDYVAEVDMIRPIGARDSVPTLAEISPRVLEIAVPANPVNVYRQAGRDCSNDSAASGYNYHYYFDPAQPECAIDLQVVSVEVVRVFERPQVFPEYDQLLIPQADGSRGFLAAIVPNRGDSDPLSRFNVHRKMLEEELGLVAEDATASDRLRYLWRQGGVSITLDLYYPSAVESTFREALSSYHLLWYNGHSAYGTKRLLTDPEAFAAHYQIIGLHSCQSYAYYVQQAMRAKATAEDPQGFASLDFVATGRSSYPADSPTTLAVLLTSLMQGMVDVDSGDRADAVGWMQVVTEMNRVVPGILYGVAGVRTNSWQP